MTRSVPARSPLDSIPPPDTIRERLALLFAEARLLRGLLRLSESKSRGVTARPDHGTEQKEASLAS
jgi:hypothetical protein